MLSSLACLLLLPACSGEEAPVGNTGMEEMVSAGSGGQASDALTEESTAKEESTGKPEPELEAETGQENGAEQETVPPGVEPPPPALVAQDTPALLIIDEGEGAESGEEGELNVDNACAATSVAGEFLPLDLYFMVDTTGSMKCPVPDAADDPCSVDPGPPYADTTRWVLASAALQSFMASPDNAGLHAGIDFFPSRRNYCNASSYAAPAVEISPLPEAAEQLNEMIGQQRPAGYTPTTASLTGAIGHARAWAESRPGRRVAVVYSTDGYPVGCDGDSIEGAAEVVRSAAMDGIPTYVLGMGRSLDALNQIAEAGGTEHAHLVDTGEDAAAQLAQALEAIRSNASLSCTVAMPEPPARATLDYDKINVRYTSGAGEVTHSLRDPSDAGCEEGWQYSEDKQQILLCGQLCEQVKADPEGQLDILLGCETRIAAPQ